MTPETGDRRPIGTRKFTMAQTVAKRLAASNVTPNQISVAGLIAAVGAGICLAATPIGGTPERILFLVASVLIVCRGLANMFDGMVAVEYERGSPTGTLYNEVPDRFSDVAIFVGAGYASGGIPELGYWAALVAVLVAFVRFAARVAGVPSDYGGIMAKQQRMFSLAGVGVWQALAPSGLRPAFGPDQGIGLVSIVLVLIIFGGVVTIAGRLHRAARWLHEDQTPAERTDALDR